MKKIISFFLLTSILIMSSCGIKDQKKELESLAKCKFEIESIKEFNIAGTPIERLIKNGNLDIARVPNIAIAALQKKIPLDAIINVQISNPTANTTTINEFDYIILLENQELANGTVDKQITIAANTNSVVPVQIKGEVYNLIFGNDSVLLNFILGDNATKANFTIKVKPTFTIAGQKIKYPGYITINKQVTREILFK